MESNWDTEVLIESFTITPLELGLVLNKTSENRLGFAILFKFFQTEGRFPYNEEEIHTSIINYIAKQLKLETSLFNKYNLKSRATRHHKSQIRDYFNFKESTVEDLDNIKEWLIKNIVKHDMNIESLKAITYERFKNYI